MLKNLYRIISIILIISLLPVLLAGCWSRREIEDLAIISAMAIDQVNLNGREKFRVSIQVIRPGQLGGGQRRGGGGGNKAPNWLISGVGETIFDAIRNFGARSPRSMVLYHNEVIIIGERTARQGIGDVLDFLSRHKDIRLRTWVVVVKGEAMDVLKSGPDLESLLSEEISELLTRTAPRVSKGAAVDLREFTEAMVTPGIDAVAGKVEVIRSTETAGEDPVNKQGEPAKSPKVEGLAAFRGAKLAGWLDGNETRGYLYIIGRAGSGIIPVKAGKGEAQEISFLMTRSQSEIVPRIERGRVTINVKIKAEGDLVEDGSPLPVAKPEILARINRDVAREIHNMAMAALQKAQKEYKADIFGFGDKVHKVEPEFWHRVKDKWDDIYPEVEVKVQVTAKIRRTGMIAEPYEIR